jgi:hypothetical protein
LIAISFDLLLSDKITIENGMNKMYSTVWQSISTQQVVLLYEAGVEKTGNLVERRRV